MLDVKALNRCSGSPNLSRDSGCVWISTLAVACVGRRAREAAELAGRHRERPGPEQGVLEAHRGLAEQAVHALVQRHHVAHLEGHAQLQVVLQVLADPGELVRNGDAVLAQQWCGSDSGQLEYLRRADAAGRKDGLDRGRGHFVLPAPDDLDPGAAPAVQTQPFHVRFGQHGEVGAVRRRLQERARGVEPHAARLVDEEVAAALVVAAVEVVGPGNAGLDHRLAVGLEDVPAQPLRFHAPLAAGAVRLVGAAEVVLALAEDREHRFPVPRCVAGQARPFVVVARLAAHVDHRVDRRAAAQHLAARVDDRAPVEALVRLGPVAPVGARVVDAEEVAHGDPDPDPVVASAGLEQQHLHVGIGREPVGQQAAGGAGADDHVVVAVFLHRGSVPPLRPVCSAAGSPEL